MDPRRKLSLSGVNHLVERREITIMKTQASCQLPHRLREHRPALPPAGRLFASFGSEAVILPVRPPLGAMPLALHQPLFLQLVKRRVKQALFELKDPFATPRNFLRDLQAILGSACSRVRITVKTLPFIKSPPRGTILAPL